MKKIIILFLILMATSVLADEKSGNKPRTIDGATGGTINGPLVVTGPATVGGGLIVDKPTSLNSAEALTNTTFATGGSSWTVTAPCVLSTGFITCTGPGTGTIKQTVANMALAPASSSLYRLLYSESTVTNTPIATLKATGGMSDADVSLTIAQDTDLFHFFQSAAAPTEFLINISLDAGDVIAFSKLSLEQASANLTNFGRVYGNLWIHGDPADDTKISRIIFTEEGLVNPLTLTLPHNSYGEIGRQGSTGVLDVRGFGTGSESLHLRGHTGSISPSAAVISIDASKNNGANYVTILADNEMISCFQNNHNDRVCVFGNGTLSLGASQGTSIIPNPNAAIGTRITPDSGTTYDLSLGSNSSNNLITTKGNVIGFGTDASNLSIEMLNGSADNLGVKLGTPLNAFSTYLQMDTLNNDENGATGLETSHCDADAEAGRMILSNRYSAPAEYREWKCTKTGASSYAWKYKQLDLSGTVTCGDGTNVCAYTTGQSAFYITLDDDADGNDVMTVTDGNQGDEVFISLQSLGGGAVALEITPSNLANGTTVTLDAAGESVTFHFDGSNWNIKGCYNSTADGGCADLVT